MKQETLHHVEKLSDFDKYQRMKRLCSDQQKRIGELLSYVDQLEHEKKKLEKKLSSVVLEHIQPEDMAKLKQDATYNALRYTNEEIYRKHRNLKEQYQKLQNKYEKARRVK